MPESAELTINGSCAPGFEGVREAFEANFTERGEIGASVAAWVEGDLVVNLWGGSADKMGERPWREDTLAAVFSGSKGLTSTCAHLLADRGEIDLDAPIALYWPEFGRAGKESITLAMVLAHRSGVIGPRLPITAVEMLDWDYVCERIAASEPWWEPNTAQGYHAVTLGFIVGEVVRRVTGRTLGQFLRTEIAEPLGIDVHIGLPAAEHHRCADMVDKPRIPDALAAVAAPVRPTSLDQHPKAAMTVAVGFLPDVELDAVMIDAWRSAEFPSTNAHVSALGLATFYNALAQEKLLTRDHMETVRVCQGGLDTDVVLGPRVAVHGWGLGYMLNQQGQAGPNRRIFGHGGSGGSYGFVDLEYRIGYSYVMNQFDATKCHADPRSVALSDAIYAALGVGAE